MMSGLFAVLGQLKNLPSDEPRLGGDASQTMTMLIGILAVVLIMLAAFKPSKRDRVQE